MGDSPAVVALPRVAVRGLLVRREAWVLTWRGRLLALLLFVGAVALVILRSYPFLAVTAPLRGEVLIVEGWLPAKAARQAAAFFHRGNYLYVLTTGCPVSEQWDDSPPVTYAEWGAAKLKRAGVPAALVHPVPCRETQRDRTFHSALAVRQWLAANHIAPASVDLVSYGPHSRRSRLLFQKALGRDIRVGVAAMEPDGYDGSHWWRNSEGVRDTMSEMFAYVYARCFFSAG